MTPRRLYPVENSTGQPTKTMSPTTDRKFRTAAEIGSEFGFARSTIYAMARRGVLPAVRIGRSVRFDVCRLVENMGSQRKLTRQEVLA